MVPFALLFVISAGALWVLTVSRKAAHKRKQLAYLATLNPPKKGKNHDSLEDRVYRLGAPAKQDPKQKAIWQQWEDLQKAGPLPLSKK